MLFVVAVKADDDSGIDRVIYRDKVYVLAGDGYVHAIK
ncbi:hypothetical protein Poly41_56270 [Novipirellula artificiosorum]|uniref:Uncharacterized protein n=1 Tax=Novipirellula artificiosorum TaxID=2528016 RepID=A0A5C6DCI7_9BACT|nr:hypothetical protein Poly41_56270 [Novipirellula artificiosorum]